MLCVRNGVCYKNNDGWNMKAHNVILLIIIIFVASFFIFAGYILNDITTKESSWRTKHIKGEIQELRLITTFPDEGLLICFKDGNFTFVNTNYYWTYAQLQTIHPGNSVNITYEINGMGSVRVLKIKELPPVVKWG